VGMRIGLIDAELVTGNRKRFPNLALMKISAYYRERGDQTFLLQDYSNLRYDRIFVSRVFTKTIVPLLSGPTTFLGGTGFSFSDYDKGLKLLPELEHIMPDYSLYDSWLSGQTKQDGLKYFYDYSIGYLTRGCTRRCPFCVNRNSR